MGFPPRHDACPAWLDDPELSLPLSSLRRSEDYERNRRVADGRPDVAAEHAAVLARSAEVDALIAARKANRPALELSHLPVAATPRKKAAKQAAPMTLFGG